LQLSSPWNIRKAQAPDNNDLNEDWLKTMYWDLGVGTVAELLIVLGNPDTKEAQNKALLHFLTLPAAQPMPGQLRNEIDAFLANA